MARIVFILTLFFIINPAFSQQEVALSPYGEYTSFRVKKANQVIDTLSIPFLDDFSFYTGNPDTAKFYNNGGVLINNNYGVNNRSRNIATFDGLDENGIPYEQIPAGGNPNTINNGKADFLVSKPINLGGLLKTDSVVFSFWWQKGSVSPVLAPELNEGDSLKLYFLDKDSAWVKVWPKGASKTKVIATLAGADFQSDSIYIDTTLFLHGGFQFMFESVGSLTGNFDVWNIDQIHLDSGRNTQYTNDYAFGKSMTSLLKNYRAMPYEQFMLDIDGELADEVGSTFYSSINTSNIINDSFYILRDTISGVELEKTMSNFDTGIPGAIIISSLGSFDAVYSPNKTLIETNLNSFTPTDEVVVLSLEMNAERIDLIDTNNSQTSYTVLDNYYAYDDGTAETGFGIIGTGGIACKFSLNKASELKSLDLSFVRNGVDNSGATINLKVWKSIKGVDGATETVSLIKTRVSVILDDFKLNKFYNYRFSSPVLLPAGTFYVGWEQINIASRYVIGLDKSQDRMDKVYAFKNGGWGQDFSGTKGTPMIRPYFGDKAGLTTAVVEFSKEEKFEIYPNPASEQITIGFDVEKMIAINVLSVNGSMIRAFEPTKTIHIEDLPQGVYILELQTDDGLLHSRFLKL